MKRFHVKNGMKKALAFSLAAAMVMPGMITAGTVKAAAEDEVSVPKPAKYFSLDKGFAKDGLKQAKFGGTIGWVEDVYPDDSIYKGLAYFSPKDGRLTSKYKEVDTVLKEGSWTSDKSVGHKGYQQVKIPAGEKKQYLPDVSDTDGTWLQFNPAANQPTTAYDDEKGFVFWLDDTLINESYPTYATTVDAANGTWTTDMSKIVRDTSGEYQEYGVNNSAAEFDNPFKGSKITYGMLGDLNGSNTIETIDALIVLQHVASGDVLDEKGKLFADVNGSGDVEVTDALAILIYIADKVPFTGPAPTIGDDDGPSGLTFSAWIKNTTAASDSGTLEDSEFFHVEKRSVGKRTDLLKKKEVDNEKDVVERQYLYFSGNGVTYVGDFKDAETACTWTLKEELKGDETVDLLSGKNGSVWNYVSYTFDGTDFHMYLNGKEAELVKEQGSKYQNTIMAFLADDESKMYLGGRGGGVKGNFNTYAIGTSADYYMDDIALYKDALNAEQITKVYTDAVAATEAAKSKQANVIGTYSFDKTSLSGNQLKAVSGADKECQPTMKAEGKKGAYGIKLNQSYQTIHGGVYLSKNPFAGQSDLTGVTISYWMKSVANKRGKVTDGVLLSFIDDEHTCTHEKVTSQAYLGANAVARSQLYLNQAFIGAFCEGVTKPVGGNSLKNTFSYRPIMYGDPDSADLSEGGKDWWKRQFEVYGKDEEGNDKSTFGDWDDLKNSLANDWNFVTVTFNNAGFKMYLNGELVESKTVDVSGERFCDFYVRRDIEVHNTDINRKGTNNAGARSMMDFLTASDTKVYLGYAFAQGTSSSYLTASECYLDELVFYDKDMTAAEVQALYNSEK